MPLEMAVQDTKKSIPEMPEIYSTTIFPTAFLPLSKIITTCWYQTKIFVSIGHVAMFKQGARSGGCPDRFATSLLLNLLDRRTGCTHGAALEASLKTSAALSQPITLTPPKGKVATFTVPFRAARSTCRSGVAQGCIQSDE